MDPTPKRRTESESDSEDYREPRGHKYFGIKSYLHNFYETVSRNPTDPDDYDDDSSMILGKSSQKRSIFWTITLIGGLASMVCGSILLIVGFTFPKMKIDIGYQEEMRIIDKSAFEFNEYLDEARVVGLVLFAVGGIFVASALLLPSLLLTEEDEEESTHFKLSIDDCGPDSSNNRNLIPVTEELKSVQPKQENTTVITNAGLKQIDFESK